MAATFDCSFSDAYAVKTLAAGSEFRIQTDVSFAASADLGANFDPDIFEVGDTPSGDYFNAFPSTSGPNVGWICTNIGGPNPPDITAGTFQTVKVVLVHTSGTTWSCSFYVDATHLGDGTVTLGVTDSDPFPINIGAIASGTGSGYIVTHRNVEVRDGSGTLVFSDALDTDFSSWDSTHGAAAVDGDTGTSSFVDSSESTGGSGGVRIAVAFDDTTFEPNPTWTYLTALDDVTAAAYTIDKGKQTENDQVDATKVVVNVFDKSGVLDPTNSSAPYYTHIAPLLQIQIELWNPVASEWRTRFRGFISDWDYVPYPGSHVDLAGVVKGYTSLEISAVGIMEPITSIELQIGAFGDTPPAGTEGNVFYDNATFQDRITQVWGNAGIDTDWLVAFTGNVEMAESRYSPSDNVMSVIQDAVDAELPSVANVYEDRFGRLAAHGRLAVFDPSGTAASTTPDIWDYHDWNAGDGHAVAASPTDTAHIRSFAFNNGTGNLFNSAYCTPAGIAEADKAGQLFTDPTSIGQYGIRSWPSKENLYISEGLLTGNTADQETAKYAEFIVTNFKDAKNRPKDMTFKSMQPDQTGAGANWDLLCKVDVGDTINVTITHAGRPADSPNFNAEPFLIQGIHERVTPLNPDYALVETTLDVTPIPSDPVTLATPAS